VPFNDNTHYNVVTGTFAGACGTCHDLAAPTTKAGPACDTCHAAGSPLTATNCTSCHAGPPDGGAPAGAAYPNIAGAHGTHIALDGAGSPVSCNTCHTGLGSRTLEHYNRAKSRVAPGDAAFTATYDAETGASAFDNSAALSCSNVSCHGGQATPNWQTGTLDVNTQCTSCHALGTAQFNSYVSGDHNQSAHRLFQCTVCHNTAALAVNHFTGLSTPAMEGPASATIGGGTTQIPAGNYVPATGSCTPSCHGDRTW
jgi:predicted CxxxxCH...CXXCH cytochrome family protein